MNAVSPLIVFFYYFLQVFWDILFEIHFNSNTNRFIVITIDLFSMMFYILIFQRHQHLRNLDSRLSIPCRI